MRLSFRHLTKLSVLLLTLTGFSTQVAAQVLFSDDFENRVKDQELIGNDWTWYEQDFADNACVGDIVWGGGPWDTPDPNDYPQENRNYWTAGQQGDSYFRAGLEVPAWDGVMTNMMRVYGNRYSEHQQCHRVLIFQEMSIASAGYFRFSFDVAQAQYGAAPANGEITGAFVKVLKSSDSSYDTLYYEPIITSPPPATSPDDVTSDREMIEFSIPSAWVGELLQFGFYSDVTQALGQSSWTSSALYDNVQLAPSPDGPPVCPQCEGVPIPLWSYFAMAGLIGLFGVASLRFNSRRRRHSI